MSTLIGITFLGGLGALIRWMLVQGESFISSSGFWPYSLLANGLGCFALGWAHHSWQQGQMSPTIYTLTTVGFLGGLTTFSGIVGQTFFLIKNGFWWQGALLFLAQWIIGFGALALAVFLTQLTSGAP